MTLESQQTENEKGILPSRCNVGVSENATEHFARTTIFTA